MRGSSSSGTVVVVEMRVAARSQRAATALDQSSKVPSPGFPPGLGCAVTVMLTVID
jgi:hypothetical protein